MFSDHFPPRAPSHTQLWLALGAGVVIICQLGALAWLADGQMDKAQTREARYTAERELLAQCIEKSSGATRHLCIRQAKAEVLASQATDVPVAEASAFQTGTSSYGGGSFQSTSLAPR